MLLGGIFFSGMFLGGIFLVMRLAWWGIGKDLERVIEQTVWLWPCEHAVR